jgi:ABC-type sugar transport system ATPase subunit
MLELREVTKRYGKTVAVNRLSIACREREFLVIFGPAGAGKTTTLRLVAGITSPTQGEIWFDGRPLTGVPPEQRNMSMAFENYNLYSHMTVFENIAFPLRARKLPDGAVRERVAQMAEALQITPLLDRRPGFLSGGQRQRVALGRALVREADVYLLDEPISHLDAKLRHLMRGELKAICMQKQATVIHVTHDYKEAMGLSDRIAVFNKGRLMQLAPPDEVYYRPANEFVASYLGDPPMSFLDAQVVRDGGAYALQAGSVRLPMSAATAAAVEHAAPDGKVRVGARATHLAASPTQTEHCCVPTEVYIVETFGYRNVVTSTVPGVGLVQSVTSPFVKVRPKETVWLNLSAENLHLFASGGEAIYHPARGAAQNGDGPGMGLQTAAAQGGGR